MDLDKKNSYETFPELPRKFFVEHTVQTSHKTGPVMNPVISIIIATKDRSEMLINTVNSLFNNPYKFFELIVIDQSKDQNTQKCLQQFIDEGKLRYIHSELSGLSRSRNLGIKLANADIIAMTDDDCIVSPEWLTETIAVFERYSEVGLVFGQVEATDYDVTKGFIPDYLIEKRFTGCRPLDKLKIRGIGACMGIRKKTWQAIGGFDNMLGAGGRLRSCEDGDIALRTLLAGWQVLETPTIKVKHAGFRTYNEGRLLTQRDWYGIGAAYIKFVRCRRFSGLVILLYEFFCIALFQFFFNLLTLHKPYGLLRLTSLIAGVIDGMRLPLDYNTYKYLETFPDKNW